MIIVILTQGVFLGDPKLVVIIIIIVILIMIMVMIMVGW